MIEVEKNVNKRLYVIGHRNNILCVQCQRNISLVCFTLKTELAKQGIWRFETKGKY